ncbi:DNA cytosine methyltransferase [Actinokineospora sp. HUAS TT18]|uniref:DNA cytosine methyltransferase n=1 Tax=Actinokineospora sp. HUAS TT18 TaxID=3447451 RepID=UPI003F526F06
MQQILAARMPDVPNLGDLRAIDWTTVEPVDVLAAGFPCQDISAAGRRIGIEKGERSGLWTDIVAGLRVLRPALFIVENVAALRWRNGGLHRVLGDLAEAGYDALWRSVRAADIGVPHRRERVFLLAWPRAPLTADAANTASARRRQPRRRRSDSPASAWTPSQLARRGERCDEVDADPDSVGREVFNSLHPRRWAVSVRPVSTAGDDQLGVPSNAPSDRRNEGLPSTTRFQRRPDAALGDHPAFVSQRSGTNLVEAQAETMDWGDYGPAVRRWEQLLGRPSPYPTQPGQHGSPVLAPPFVEHLMGLPQGWITDIPLARTAHLRALGNGVVPQQAAHALSHLLKDLAGLLQHDPVCGRSEDDAAA